VQSFCLSSVATLTTKLQIASGSNVSIRTVCLDFNEIGFHGRTAAHKPKITMRNAKRWLEWYKARAQGTPSIGVEELDCPAQSPDLNPFEHLWDELKRRLRARPNRPNISAPTSLMLLWLNGSKSPPQCSNI
jgi:hypothetical protein